MDYCLIPGRDRIWSLYRIQFILERGKTPLSPTVYCRAIMKARITANYSRMRCTFFFQNTIYLYKLLAWGRIGHASLCWEKPRLFTFHPADTGIICPNLEPDHSHPTKSETVHEVCSSLSFVVDAWSLRCQNTTYSSIGQQNVISSGTDKRKASLVSLLGVNEQSVMLMCWLGSS